LMAGELGWDITRKNEEMTRFQRIASSYII
jgi:hypothetical protein